MRQTERPKKRRSIQPSDPVDDVDDEKLLRDFDNFAKSCASRSRLEGIDECIQQAARVPLLTHEEEIAIGQRIEQHWKGWRRALLSVPLVSRQIVALWQSVLDGKESVLRVSRRARNKQYAVDNNTVEVVRQNITKSLAGIRSCMNAPQPQNGVLVHPATEGGSMKVEGYDVTLEEIVRLLEAEPCKDQYLVRRFSGDPEAPFDVLKDNLKLMRAAEQSGDSEQLASLVSVVGLIPDELEAQLEQARFHLRNHAAAKQKMAQRNLRLVISIAKKYSDKRHPLIDLIQEGITGLMEAADKYEWQRGFKFSTHATWWIRQAVTRDLSKMRDVMIDDDDMTIGSQQIDSREDSPVENANRQDQREILFALLQQLDERQREILMSRTGCVLRQVTDPVSGKITVEIDEARYGISRTLGDISEQMGVTRQWISHIESKGLRQASLFVDPVAIADADGGVFTDKIFNVLGNALRINGTKKSPESRRHER